MRKILFILFLVPLVMFSQSKRDQKKYNNIMELIKQNELTEVWSFNQIKRWGNTKHFAVYGCN